MRRIQMISQRMMAGALVAILLWVGLAAPALAHGAKITYTVATQIELQAAYDSGEPMAGAQVAVYAPDDPSTPWLTGKCDEEGRFRFAPDPTRPGAWDVQVRQAGHGNVVHIPVGAEGAGGGSFSTAQIALMAVSVAWGFVGTALFFSRRKVA